MEAGIDATFGTTTKADTTHSNKLKKKYLVLVDQMQKIMVKV